MTFLHWVAKAAPPFLILTIKTDCFLLNFKANTQLFQCKSEAVVS